MAFEARLALGIAVGVLLGALGLVACGDDDGVDGDGSVWTPPDARHEPPGCAVPSPIAVGETTGHPDPLGAGPGEARAGRLSESGLPVDPTGLGTVAIWDFVLANSKVAVVIEDVGFSDIYDPWGGKIVG